MGVHNELNFDRFYKSRLYSDVEFVVQNRKGVELKIPAHRMFLMSQSSVFESMLYGDSKEGDTIKLEETTAEVFEEFLQFFYMRDVELTHENFAGVVQLVDKYLVMEFLPLCTEFMERTLTETVAYDYYELVLKYDMPRSIRGKLEDIICKNPDLVLKKKIVCESWLMVLSQVLKLDRFACKELDIFNCVMTSAKDTLQQIGHLVSVDSIKNVLGDIIYDIRFPIMNLDELMECFRVYPALLTSEQCLDIIHHVTTKKALTKARRFNCNPRLCNEYEITLLRWREPQGRRSSSVISFVWTLESSMKYLMSFIMYCNDGLSPPSVTVTIKQNEQVEKSVVVPLLACECYTERVCRIPYPVEFNGAGDECSITILWKLSSFAYISSEIASDSIIPSGLLIKSGENGFVSRICLLETF